MRIEIDVNKIIENQRKNLKDDLKKFAWIIKEKVDEKTPEDTKELLWNNLIWPLEQVGTQIGIRVFNKTEYAPYVEYWVWRNFEYNKPKWNIFYKWIWAWMFGRTWQEYKNKFIELTKK